MCKIELHSFFYKKLDKRGRCISFLKCTSFQVQTFFREFIICIRERRQSQQTDGLTERVDMYMYSAFTPNSRCYRDVDRVTVSQFLNLFLNIIACSPKSFLIFWPCSPQFIIDRFLMKKECISKVRKAQAFDLSQSNRGQVNLPPPRPG